MVVIFRLKRRFFFYKFFITVSVVIIFLIVYFRIFEISYSIVSKPNINCQYEEPIDVVYTWVNGSDPEFLKNLDSFVKSKNDSIDSAKRRFDDKYELKFSLRSLETYAPWVNHVYIVTNGQIPYWLNLDYDKVSIITHEEIFRDTISLPSFSSPAIECNLHKIPGLSKKFIYFNDDIFLGKPTYLEDFYSPNKGFLIYLAWPVPPCAPSCSWMYVADGQCDKACLRPECQMDGGDCSNPDEKVITFEISTENSENLIEEEVAKNQILAETIQKVRANFYKSFLKKLLPAKTGTESNQITTPQAITSSITKRSNYLLNIFSVKDMKNLSNFVNEHNKVTLKNDKLERNKRKRKRALFKSNNRTFMNKLHPSIDAYSASLQHTNRILNRKYGFKSRKVPSHAPILIDKEVMEDLQNTFAKEFAVTERNRVRREDDVQFSFSYYYFVISETVKRSIGDIFDKFDTDVSSTWSDREIRTLLSKLYELPLSHAKLDHFESLLLNCSENGNFPEVATPPFERYVDSELPTITKSLVTNCPTLNDILTQRFGVAPKYRYEIVHNSESQYVTFKMLNSNISDVVSNLDEIRSHTKKFVCLNDNLDETKTSENDLVRAILYDFYLSLFPHPSKFELPDEFRNRFSYIRELNEWKQNRSNMKLIVYCLVSVWLCYILFNLCKKKCCQIANKLFC